MTRRPRGMIHRKNRSGRTSYDVPMTPPFRLWRLLILHILSFFVLRSLACTEYNCTGNCGFASITFAIGRSQDNNTVYSSSPPYFVFSTSPPFYSLSCGPGNTTSPPHFICGGVVHNQSSPVGPNGIFISKFSTSSDIMHPSLEIAMEGSAATIKISISSLYFAATLSTSQDIFTAKVFVFFFFCRCIMRLGVGNMFGPIVVFVFSCLMLIVLC